MTTNNLSVDQLIETLELRPLDVCGGYFQETWRDEHATVIHWLLPSEHFAALHAAKYPEIVTYTSGAPLRITLLNLDGRLSEHTLGPEISAGQRPHLVIPANVWQAAHTLGDYSLSSVVVAPPFTPDIVTVANVEALCQAHPEHADHLRSVAVAYTRPTAKR